MYSILFYSLRTFAENEMCAISSQHQFAQLIKHNDAAITTSTSVDCVYPASVSASLSSSPHLHGGRRWLLA